MQLLTVDFETYFSDDYTLSKMTTESYVRDSRFQTHCVGVMNDKSKRAFNKEQFAKIAHILNGQAVIFHHAHFDGLILSHHYKVRPAFYYDTLSMARLVFPHERSHSLGNLAKKFGLHEKTVPYQDFKNKLTLEPELQARLEAGCLDDLDLTYSVFQKLLPHVPKMELRLIDLTVRMFTEPALGLDRALAQSYLESEQDRKANLLKLIGATEEDLQSAEKFANILRELGVEPPMKKSLKTGKMSYAFAKTDPGFKELLESDREEVVNIVNARLGVKSTIGETRAQRFLDTDSRGAMPVYLKPFGAHTFRWAAGDKMNFQNLQRGGALRKSLLAPKGFRIGVGDLSQIECRVNAHLSKEQWVLDAFANKRDLYCEMASDIYSKQVTKADARERFVGKTTVLGAGYGMGNKKFRISCKAQGVSVTEQEAERAIFVYRHKHPHITANWRYGEFVLEQLYSGGPKEIVWGPMVAKNHKIALPNGSALDYSPLTYDGDFTLTMKGKPTKIYGARLVENVVQALSRIIIANAMLEIAKRYKVVLTVHDEVVFLMPEAEADEGLQWVLNTMRQTPSWMPGLPLDAEGGHDIRYSK